MTVDRQEIEAKLGVSVRQIQGTAGGDINQAHRLTLEDGRAVFMKTHASGPTGMFPAEAQGLRWLADAQVIRVPEVLGCSDGVDGRDGFLLLEWIELGRPASGFDEDLGRQLAALHRSGAPGFGGCADNFIGYLPQSNTTCPNWAKFYGTQRLEPQIRRAVDSGRMSSSALGPARRLLERLPELVGPEEAPSRLHGDLWGGNHGADASGAPLIFDPAVYGGHREMDLAMMRLFGGYSRRCFDAYDEAFPLEPGHQDRMSLFQLYPVLVHVNLFGGGYCSQARAIIENYK